jgi:F-type H+-transporting ATPase subunit a
MAAADDHVKDQSFFHIFDSLFGGFSVHLPNLAGFQLTKYMVLELVAAGLIIAIFVPLARRAQSGEPPKGRWWNAFESLLTFVRDEIAIPNLGHHHADLYSPFLWTLFLFILFCNLLGMVPFMGSPTASIWVTGGLAVCAFVALHGAAIADMGLGHYLKSQWPHIHLGDNIFAQVFAFGLCLMIFTIELAGTVIKSGVLAVRLFANMFAGHMVLASILLFIVMAGEGGYSHIWGLVTVSSVLGVVALSLLELFVAFLQAYIFVFLTALFMGMALHPQH